MESKKMPLPACTLISWQTIYRLGRELARVIDASGFRPDIVVAIGRGGYVPARLVCDFLHLDQLTGIKVEHYAATRKQAEVVIRYPLNTDVRGLDVLIVDDVNDSGDTLAAVVRYLDGFAPGRVRTAVLHEKNVTAFPADYVAKRTRKWRWIVYPWAYIEDVTSFVRALQPPPLSAEEARQRLRDDHGIRVTRQTLQDVLDFMAASAPQGGNTT
jgi:hypoxanthine phosphoribosyltransferase